MVPNTVPRAGSITSPGISVLGGRQPGSSTFASSRSSAAKAGLSRGERLEEFVRRLDRGDTPANADDALTHVNRTLDEVENELSGIPRNPNPRLEPDGRMYPPQADNILRHPNGSITARSPGHITEIGRNGSITIRTRDGT